MLQLKEVVLLLLQSLQRVLHASRLRRVQQVRRVRGGPAARGTVPLILRRTVVVVGLVGVVQRMTALREEVGGSTNADVRVTLTVDQAESNQKAISKCILNVFIIVN